MDQTLQVMQKLHLTTDEFKALDRNDQEAYLKTMNLEVDWIKTRKILLYEPQEKQSLFHLSPCPRRALFGGNRVGKTMAGGMEFLYHMTGLYPSWYPVTQRMKGAIKGRIVATDFQKGVGEVIQPFLTEWLDDSMIKRRVRNPQGVAVKYELKNGSVFDILTHEQTTKQFEGWRGHLAWFDEPPPRDKYVATLRGLVDYGGKHWLTLTPLTEPWIYDDIYTSMDKRYTYCVTIDIRENKYLSEADIKDFEASLSEEEKEARLHGRFLHLTGLIYKEFDVATHVIDPPEIKKSWSRYMAIDAHERTPTAVVWLAVDEKENHYIYDELRLKDMDISMMAEAIQAQEGLMTAGIKLIDPHNDKDNMAAGGFNIRKEFMKHGVFTQRGNSDPALGKARIRQALTLKYSPVLRKKVPQLYVSRYCTNTIYEFQHYIWEERARNREEFNAKEVAKKKNDHFMDCIRYIYNYGPRFIVPDSEEDMGEVSYTGTYTKTPVKQASNNSSYYSLTERAGQF